ncbi:MAG TPA: hypothetical protein VHV10_21405 [Ktedonobacteraceae bacterium]|jgi:uncharacterized protein (DUF433 family)|nr:hypothetical protein [Ktedonobacteraceae bacterium]
MSNLKVKGVGKRITVVYVVAERRGGCEAEEIVQLHNHIVTAEGFDSQ